MKTPEIHHPAVPMRMDSTAVFEQFTALYEPARRTIPQLLLQRAAALGDKPLLTIGPHSYTCADLAQRAGKMAQQLQIAGIGAGDRVALLCGNRIEFLDVFFGCAWINAVCVPINRSARGPQLQHILHNCGARLLVMESEAADALRWVDKADLAVSHIWLIGPEAPTAPIAGWPSDRLPEGQNYRSPVSCSPADTTCIIYTSGTTGPSKGVCCPQAQFFWWAVHAIDVLEIETRDVLLTSLPLFHVNALCSVFQALLSGASLTVLDRFSAGGFVPSLHDTGATLTYLLGAMVPILLSTAPAAGQDAAHAVRRALAPGVSAQLAADFAKRFGIGLIEGYGSTETNFVIGDRLSDQVPGSMGRCRPGFAARVVDAEDNPLPPGSPGELVVRSEVPHSFSSGYFLMPETTVESRRNLWFHTGDRVYCDAAGRFYFMDRLKDAIRRRGENVSAYEVEQVLLSHPSVASAAVYPVAAALGEEEIMAAIKLHDGASLAAEALLDFCQPRMAYFSIPRFVLFVDTLPATETGKIQKFKLREQGVTPQTWDREAAGYVLVRPGRTQNRLS